MKKFSITKADIILFACFIIIGIAGIALLIKAPSEDARVIVSVNGETVHNVSLYDDAVFNVETEDGFNTVEIKDGKVRVSDADCHSNVCVNTGWIEKEGQVIVCATHKLVVNIVPNKKVGGGYDAVSY